MSGYRPQAYSEEKTPRHRSKSSQLRSFERARRHQEEMKRSSQEQEADRSPKRLATENMPARLDEQEEQRGLVTSAQTSLETQVSLEDQIDALLATVEPLTDRIEELEAGRKPLTDRIGELEARNKELPLLSHLRSIRRSRLPRRRQVRHKLKSTQLLHQSRCKTSLRLLC